MFGSGCSAVTPRSWDTHPWALVGCGKRRGRACGARSMSPMEGFSSVPVPAVSSGPRGGAVSCARGVSRWDSPGRSRAGRRPDPGCSLVLGRETPMSSGRRRVPSWQRQGTFLMGIVAQVLRLCTGWRCRTTAGRSSPRASGLLSPDPSRSGGGGLLSSASVPAPRTSCCPGGLTPVRSPSPCWGPPGAGSLLLGCGPLRASRERGADGPSHSQRPTNLLYFCIDSWGPACPGRPPSLGQAPPAGWNNPAPEDVSP